MAKLGIIKRITKEDLGSEELPAWINPFLSALNNFISSVASALQARLTFEDNFLANVKSVKFSSGVEKKINPSSGRLRVTGVIPLQTGKQMTGFYWVPKEDGSIGLTFTFSGGGEATCKVLILLG